MSTDDFQIFGASPASWTEVDHDARHNLIIDTKSENVPELLDFTLLNIVTTRKSVCTVG